MSLSHSLQHNGILFRSDDPQRPASNESRPYFGPAFFSQRRFGLFFACAALIDGSIRLNNVAKAGIHG